MTPKLFTRRKFSLSLASLVSIFGIAGIASGKRSSAARLAASDELTHTAGAIHQEVIFNASRKRVYQALTDASQFDRVVRLSEAGMSMGNKPTQISGEVGGTFSLFGGYILGRHIEMVPNERLVQAWREASWPPGVYSLVGFELTEEGGGTKLILDHTGFPGTGQHLVPGWKAQYWDPLKKVLAQPSGV